MPCSPHHGCVPLPAGARAGDPGAAAAQASGLQGAGKSSATSFVTRATAFRIVCDCKWPRKQVDYKGQVSLPLQHLPSALHMMLAAVRGRWSSLNEAEQGPHAMPLCTQQPKPLVQLAPPLQLAGRFQRADKREGPCSCIVKCSSASRHPTCTSFLLVQLAGRFQPADNSEDADYVAPSTADGEEDDDAFMAKVCWCWGSKPTVLPMGRGRRQTVRYHGKKRALAVCIVAIN